MRASILGAVAALWLAGCSFAVHGVQAGNSVDADDLSMPSDAADLASAAGDDLATLPPADMALGPDMTPPPLPADMALGPDMTPPPTGLLTGAIAVTSTAAPINLTTDGITDWAHWGTTSATSFDRKNVTQQLSNFTNVGGTTIAQYGAYALGFSWSDGTPTATATNSTTGVYTTGMGSGFRFTAPADTTTRTLKVYAGGQTSTATVTAHLSDGSAADYTTSTMNGAGDGTQYERTVTLVYRALAAGQTLTVSWVQSSAGGYVHLHSAALSP